MATSYSGRYSKPLGAGDDAFGGAGLNLGIEGLAGETELVTTFDDFNIRHTGSGNGGNAPFPGWVSTDVGVPVGEQLSCNDPSGATAAPQATHFQSSLRVLPGTAEDTGSNIQIDGSADTERPHIWIQDRDADADGNDNMTVVFACRIGLGLAAAAAANTWQGKVFIGFAQSGNQQVMTPATGVIDATNGTLLGFHVAEDGHIDLISTRENIAAPLVDGTHFTQMVDTDWNAGLIALGDAGTRPTWFDLALRAEVRDASNAAQNGAVQAFVRPQLTQAALTSVTPIPGRRQVEQSNADVANPIAWRPVDTVLQNQLWNDTGLEIVPTIEVQNGGDVVGEDVAFWLDWWSMGISRSSRR